LSTLPTGWSSWPVPPEVQAIGDRWIRSGRALALRVPSAVVRGSSNLLINPDHPEFARFRIEAIEPYVATAEELADANKPKAVLETDHGTGHSA
jgi:RES domain-containing protein